MPVKLCLTARCGEIATSRGYCHKHAAELRKGNRSPFNSFYASKPWRLARRKQLFDHPLCQYVEDGDECGQLAEVVHHIEDLRDGGAPRDPANLMSCCKPHHDRITMQRTRGKGER